MTTNAARSPGRRRWILRALIGLALCFLLVWLIFALGSWSQRIVIDFDYLEDLNAPAQAVPESERAWPALREALLSLDLQGRDSFLEFLEACNQDASSEWLPDWFARNESGLERIREAVSREHLGFLHVYGVPIGDDRLVLLSGFERENAAQLPSGAVRSVDAPPVFMPIELEHRFTKIPRGLARLLIQHAEQSVREGAPGLAVQDIAAVLDLGRLVAQDRMLISQLVGLSLNELALKASLKLMANPDFQSDREALDALAQVLDDPRVRPGPVDFHGERAAVRDLIQRFYTTDGSGDGRLDVDGFAAMSTANGTPLPIPLHFGLLRSIMGPFVASAGSSRAEVESVARRCYDAADDLQTQDVWAMDWTEYDAAFGPVSATGTGVLSSLELFPLPLLMPSLDRTIMSSHQSRFQFDLVRLVLALQRHRIDEGAWPDTLQALVPGESFVVPLDPHDGEPLRYRLVEGAPMLWSVGPDRIDESGVTSPELVGPRWLMPKRDAFPIPDGDLVLWPLESEDGSRD